MKLQKGLDDLIIKYSVGTAAALSESGESAVINGEEYPLLPWESERRFYEMKNTFETRLGNPCTFRVGYTAHRGTDLFALLRREIGVIEYVLSSDIKSIYAVRGGSAMNCIATAANGCICTLELAATLCAEDKEIDKHELMTDAGHTCDRVVDTQIPQESIYVYGESRAVYTDTDAELYGFSEREAAIVRNALALAKSPSAREHNRAKSAHIGSVVRACAESLETCLESEVK